MKTTQKQNALLTKLLTFGELVVAIPVGVLLVERLSQPQANVFDWIVLFAFASLQLVMLLIIWQTYIAWRIMGWLLRPYYRREFGHGEKSWWAIPRGERERIAAAADLRALWATGTPAERAYIDGMIEEAHAENARAKAAATAEDGDARSKEE